MLKIIDQLDPSENVLDEDNLAKFLSKFDHSFMNRTPKGPDYIVIDDFD